ncbi:uncharacterized protein LOC113359972 [Papaver somniferum]|uniref:uncharacterized protein LOC113359972 n=1 Tax=Papaver somniferum TaxID=3469 RepID=UPI000E6FE538|nr:uncharacterized protein LOC113359972 [Papaver somniferum]
MKYPVQGRPLILFTASSDVAIGALLSQEDEEGIERPIYYFSRTMRDDQLRYPKAERTCLALVHAIQRFKYYLLSNRVVLVAKADPIKFLLSKPALIGRPAKWLLQMSEFDVACVPPKAIKGQTVADLLAAFLGEDITMLHEEVPGEFPEISIIQEETLLLYLDGSATPRNDTGGAGIVLLAQVEDTQSNDWRAPIIHELRNSLTEGKVSLKELKNFFLLHGALYYRNPDGSLSRCLGEEEAGEQLKCIHEEICGHTLVVTLYRRLQRLGYNWPSMEAQSRMLQGSCPNCQTPPHHLEVLTIHHTGNWREPYIKYLHDNDLPSEKKVAVKLVQRAKRFVYLEGILYRKIFGGNLLRCLAEHEILTILKEMHECEHQGKKKLFLQIHEIYYWTTMEDDAAAYVRRYHQCQDHDNLIHTPCLPLNSVSSPWPFYN